MQNRRQNIIYFYLVFIFLPVITLAKVNDQSYLIHQLYKTLKNDQLGRIIENESELEEVGQVDTIFGSIEIKDDLTQEIMTLLAGTYQKILDVTVAHFLLSQLHFERLLYEKIIEVVVLDLALAVTIVYEHVMKIIAKPEGLSHEKVFQLVVLVVIVTVKCELDKVIGKLDSNASI